MTEQIHPDEMVDKVSKLMAENGYGLTQIRFCNQKTLNGGVCLPVYQYGVDTIKTFTFGKGYEIHSGIMRRGKVDD